MTTIVNTEEILNLIPHRYPFLLVDRVLDYMPFEHLTAIKNVTMNEPCFQGHFPGNPVMPGVLILEALAQAAGILSSVSRQPKDGYKFVYFFASIDNVKFKHVVTPGDQLRLEVSLLTRKGDFWRIQGKAYVGEKLACSADMMSAAKEVKRDQ
ncbi:MAG: 3-hydroxyacyl-ACP dehydratase FabZ [Legionella sp.]|jgi:3-hydroxyacyl-[acyl-carrier-protein] dehydratase|nr:3-hydroxyacyl-ACP dehydratase FabZ [Legionella sp.]